MNAIGTLLCDLIKLGTDSMAGWTLLWALLRRGGGRRGDRESAQTQPGCGERVG